MTDRPTAHRLRLGVILALTFLAACATPPPPPIGGDAPATPTGLAAAPGDGELLLSWEANDESDLAHYNLFQEGGTNLVVSALVEVAQVPAGTTSYLVTELINGQLYSFAIDAESDAGERSERSATIIASPSEAPPVAAPTGLSATAGSDSDIALTWDASDESDLDRYHVYQELVGSGLGAQAFEKIAEVDVGTESYTAAGLVVDNEYAFYITAVLSDDTESEPSATVSTTTVDGVAPTFPQGLSTTAGDGEVALTWDANDEPDLDRYEILQGTASNSLSKVAEVAAGSEATTITGLTNGTTYYFAIAAIDASGNRSANSIVVDATPTAAGPSPIRVFGRPGPGGVFLRVHRDGVSVPGATVTMNGTDIPYNAGFARYEGSYDTTLTPGDTLNIIVEEGGFTITGSTDYPDPISVDSLDGESYAASETIPIAWTSSTDPDGFELAFLCRSGDCFSQVDVLVVGSERSLDYAASNLVANSVYELLIVPFGLVDDWAGGPIDPTSEVWLVQGAGKTGEFQVTP
jgi:hypothetical protein